MLLNILPCSGTVTQQGPEAKPEEFPVLAEQLGTVTCPQCKLLLGKMVVTVSKGWNYFLADMAHLQPAGEQEHGVGCDAGPTCAL